MGLSEVGLRYVSEGAKEFIQNADKATNEVTKLNLALARSSGVQNFNRVLSAGTTSLDNFSQQTQEATKSSTSFSKQLPNVGKEAKSYDKVLIGASGTLLSFATQSSKTTEVMEKASKAFSGNEKSMGSFIDKLTVASTAMNFFKEDEGDGGGIVGLIFNARKLQKLIGLWAKMPPPIQAATVAIGAFVAASTVTKLIGGRAAGLTAIQDSFDRLSQSAGLSTNYIKEFAASADNQLTQQELLIKTNKALAGSTGEFATELADSLPTLLEFSRVRSAATGENVEFLFESAIQGIKKGQPLILDNLGLVVKLEEVYQDYAKSLGTTVDALSGTQKQQALLTATNKAAKEAIGVLGEATLSNADKMAAQKNVISDILDKISLSVQPLLSVFLDMELFLLRLMESALTPLINIFGSVASIIADVLVVAFNMLKDPIEFVFVAFEMFAVVFEQTFRVIARISQAITSLAMSFNAVSPILQIFIKAMRLITSVIREMGDLVVGVIDFFSYLFSLIGQGINAISPFAKAIGWINERLDQTGKIVDNLAEVLGYKFGQALASLVNVFAKAADKILDLVAKIAEGIASFLMGNSPPPKGPLSKIDVGGRKTFEAFLDGMASVGTRPVELIAKQVDQALGKIGKFSYQQVENRLKQLDLALRPFSEQLEIAKSRFEAMSAPAEAALRAIDRQLDNAIMALTEGDVAARKSVQALDAQRAAIQKNLDLQQQKVDFAQIELAIAKSQQAEERALLDIRKKRLGGKPLTQTEKAVEKQVAQRSQAAKATQGAKGGGAGASAVGGEGAGGATGKVGTETGSNIGDLILQGFAENLDYAALEGIGESQSRIGEAGANIAQGLNDLPNRLVDAFDIDFSVREKLNEVKDTITRWIDEIKEFFTGGEGGDSIQTRITNAFDANLTVSGMLDEIETTVTSWINRIKMFFVGDGEGTLSYALTSPFTRFKELITVDFSEGGIIATTLANFFGLGGLLEIFTMSGGEMFDGFVAKVDNFIGKLTGREDSLQSVMDYVFGEEGLLFGTLESGKQLFSDFYEYVFGDDGLFSNLAETLRTLLITAINSTLSSIANTVNMFIDFFEGIINTVLEQVGTIVDKIPDTFKGPLANIPREISFGEVSFQVPGAAKGGLFSGGMLRVGENGEELLTSANKMAVFPNSFVTSVDHLANVLEQSMNIPTSGNMVSNSQVSNVRNSNVNVNINQPMNPTTTRQQLNNLRF